MTNGIIQGIVDALAAAFPSVTLYTEKVPQNFDEPSFRVKALQVINRAEFGTRRLREIPCDVLYFPGNPDDAETEWNGVAVQLFDALEWITANGVTLRGNDLAAEFDSEQEVGHFRVTYRFHLLNQPDEIAKMQNLGVSKK